MPRVVLVMYRQVLQNYALILSDEEADAWERHQVVRRKIRKQLKQRAIELGIPIVCVYRLSALIEAWKVRAVDW